MIGKIQRDNTCYSLNSQSFTNIDESLGHSTPLQDGMLSKGLPRGLSNHKGRSYFYGATIMGSPNRIR